MAASNFRVVMRITDMITQDESSPLNFYSKRIVETNENLYLILGLKGLTLSDSIQ